MCHYFLSFLIPPSISIFFLSCGIFYTTFEFIQHSRFSLDFTLVIASTYLFIISVFSSSCVFHLFCPSPLHLVSCVMLPNPLYSVLVVPQRLAFLPSSNILLICHALIFISLFYLFLSIFIILSPLHLPRCSPFFMFFFLVFF